MSESPYPPITPDASQSGLGHAPLGYREFVGLAVALMATSSLALDAMLPAFPDIRDGLGVADARSLPWIVSAFLLGLGVAQVLWGPLSDRFGRRPILITGLGSYVLLGLAGALAPDFRSLVLLRALQGVAVAATRIVATSIVRDCYHGRTMARVMSVVMMTFLAVPVLAPSIGRLLLVVMPWRGLFLMLALFGGAVLLWAAARLPETLPVRYRRALSFRGVALAFRAVLTDRSALGYILAMTALSGATYGFINSVQFLFATTFRAPDAMPPVFALLAGMMGVASMFNARIVERLGTRLVSHTALLLFILIELCHLATVTLGDETLVRFILFQGLAMFAFGLVSTNFGALSMERLAHVAGTAASAQGFVSMAGGALIGLAIARQFDGTALPVIMGFAGNAIIALICVLFAERGRLFNERADGLIAVTESARR
jgi:MFS transporter, DHA1 family, multidrug resistance protein